MKKFSFLIMIVLLLTLFSVSAAAAETSGTCGDNLTWTFESGVLTVSGTGPMYDYGEQMVSPWEDMRMEVTEVVIENGVTTIGTDAFVHFENMAKVTLPKTLKSINLRAFADCYKLKAIDLPKGLTTIRADAFRKCYLIKELEIPASVTLVELTGLDHCEKLAFKGSPKLEGVSLDEPDGEWETKVKEVWFYGDAPTFMYDWPYRKATIYYPAGNVTWTKDVMDRCGTKVTWVAKCFNGHTEVPDKAVEAGCTTTGLTAGKHCSACGEVTQKQQKVEAKGHSYGPWEQIKAPTEQEVGTQQRKCSVCGKTENQDIPKLTGQEQIPTEGNTQPTADTSPTEGQTEPQETEPVTEPATKPAGTTEQDDEPKAETPWTVIIVAGVLVLAGGAAAVWVFVIKKRR